MSAIFQVLPPREEGALKDTGRIADEQTLVRQRHALDRMVDADLEPCGFEPPVRRIESVSGEMFAGLGGLEPLARPTQRLAAFKPGKDGCFDLGQGPLTEAFGPSCLFTLSSTRARRGEERRRLRW